jgi:hypothetical protein
MDDDHYQPPDDSGVLAPPHCASCGSPLPYGVGGMSFGRGRYRYLCRECRLSPQGYWNREHKCVEEDTSDGQTNNGTSGG